jgi:hypothetical protein
MVVVLWQLNRLGKNALRPQCLGCRFLFVFIFSRVIIRLLNTKVYCLNW